MPIGVPLFLLSFTPQEQQHRNLFIDIAFALAGRYRETIQNTQGVATLCPGLCACCPFRAEGTYRINLSKRLCQNSFVSLRARPAIPYYLDSHDRMRCRVKPGKTRRERLHHFDTPTN